MAMQLPRSSFRKIAAATAVICDELGGKVGRLLLMKILYASDRESVEQVERTITGDIYYSVKRGPILSATLHLAKGELPQAEQAEWDQAFDRTEHEVLIKEGVQVDTEALSEFEERVIRSHARRLEDLKSKLGPMGFINLLHEDWREWKNPGERRIHLPLSDMLREGLNFSSEDASRIAQQDSYAKCVASESDLSTKHIITAR